jgi:cobalamin-dependent methionine synthase I
MPARRAGHEQSVEQGGKAAFVKQLREDYEKLRSQHAVSAVKLLSLEAARANAPKLKYDDLPKPEFGGVRTLSSGAIISDEGAPSSAPDHAGAFGVSLEEVVPFIDWTPFFHTWELRGVYPKILQHEKHGEEATKLFADAQKLLAEFVANKSLQLRAVYGLFPANSVGDDVEVYTDESRQHVRTKFHFLRQQIEKGDGTPNWCLADFIAPKSDHAPRPTPHADHIGAFAVTSGHGLQEIVEGFKAKHDDYNAIMAEAIADRLAEAFAEYLHKRVRDEWGYGKWGKTHQRRPHCTKNIAASARRQVIQPVPITLKKRRSGNCWTWRNTPASSLPKVLPCGRAVQCERALFRASGFQVLRRRQARQGSGRPTSPSAKANRSPKWNAGSGRG